MLVLPCLLHTLLFIQFVSAVNTSKNAHPLDGSSCLPLSGYTTLSQKYPSMPR